MGYEDRQNVSGRPPLVSEWLASCRCVTFIKAEGQNSYNDTHTDCPQRSHSEQDAFTLVTHNEFASQTGSHFKADFIQLA